MVDPEAGEQQRQKSKDDRPAEAVIDSPTRATAREPSWSGHARANPLPDPEHEEQPVVRARPENQHDE